MFTLYTSYYANRFTLALRGAVASLPSGIGRRHRYRGVLEPTTALASTLVRCLSRPVELRVWKQLAHDLSAFDGRAAC